MTTFQTIARNLVLEASSVGTHDGIGYIDGWKFTTGGLTGQFIQNSFDTSFGGAFGQVATLSSVLVSVPGMVSVGGNGPYDIPFTAAGPASGTAVTVVFTSPSISSGQIVSSTWTKV